MKVVTELSRLMVFGVRVWGGELTPGVRTQTRGARSHLSFCCITTTGGTYTRRVAQKPIHITGFKIILVRKFQCLKIACCLVCYKQLCKL